MADTAALLGTWNMTAWKKENVDTGEKIDALGPDPVGYINYGPDGRFYALVVSRDRTRPATLPPSDAEKLKLFDSMLAYAGTYSVDNEKAVHHVDASWNQAWTGTDQVRFYKLEGDKLTISGAPAKDPYTGKQSHSPDRISADSKTGVMSASDPKRTSAVRMTGGLTQQHATKRAPKWELFRRRSRVYGM